MKLNKLINLKLIILELYVVLINISAALNANGFGVVEINNEKLEIENKNSISATSNRGEYFFEVMEILDNNQKESDYFGIG